MQNQSYGYNSGEVFGLTFNSWKREGALKNILNTFQDQEKIEDLDCQPEAGQPLAEVQFKWRNHMQEIGRFFNVDPLADKYVYNSPYAFSENRVIDGVELEGLEWEYFMNSASYGRRFENAQTLISKGSAGSSIPIIMDGIVGIFSPSKPPFLL